MNINSPQELSRFLVGNGIVGICPEAQNLVACLDILVRMCACDPQEAKTARFNQCKQSYVGFAARANDFKSKLLEKSRDNSITFYLNGQRISEIRR